MSDLTADATSLPEIGTGARSNTNQKAVVVGLYGVPGSGKTFLLKQLKQELGERDFAFYEGSEKIAALVPGGLDAFQILEESEKMKWRELAIESIAKECFESGRVAIVAAHLMFWPEGEEAGREVYTQSDLETFTHILYLDIPEEVLSERRLEDSSRSRPSLSIAHLGKWQQAEIDHLRVLCRNNGILFLLLSRHAWLLDQVSTLLCDFQRHNENYNLSLAESMLDKNVAVGNDQLETVLVMDADRTLTAVDTGVLFWERVRNSLRMHEGHPLKTLFSSSLGYSYTAFRQATFLYEEAADDANFDAICEDVASAVVMHPEFTSLLRLVAKERHIGAVIVSCGLRRVWEKVLEREGLSKTVKVIAGGRITDGFVVTAEVKTALVTRLQDTHKKYVWAFGDSPLDLGMLSKADQAITVVGEEHTRSKTMDAALEDAINTHGLQVRQVLLPSHGSPRLDTNKLPLLELTEQTFLDAVLCRRAGLEILHATGRTAAKLLMTPMRDASVSGPALREIHRRVGRYLATEFLSDMIGVEEYPIPHVQGHQTNGYRLLDEQKTSIVALMRGGEPMAFGVSDICPSAMFVHAKNPEDIKYHHLQGQSTVVLVDSVVNNGKTVVQFEEHVRRLHAAIRIVFIAGVIQAKSVSTDGLIWGLARTSKLNLIALRLSENKFTGKGTTDTGNRLFGTTHVP